MVKQNGIPVMRNNDRVVGFMNSKQVKSIQGYQDLSTLQSWYHEDPLNNHLGLIDFWGNQKTKAVPIYKDLLKNKNIIEVDGIDSGFTYDVPMEEGKGCVTELDMSDQPAPGIDGAHFKIALNRSYKQGDVLAYDPMFGEQIIVSDDEPVKRKGSAFIHTVKMVTRNKRREFPRQWLKKGISYYKLNHAGGEYTTEFSSVEMIDQVGHMTCEFKLGSLRGVESYVTGAADMKTKGFSGAAASTQQYIKQLEAEKNSLGEYMFVTGLDTNGAPDMKKASIGKTMEWLTMRELEKLTAHSLLLQRGGTVQDNNGSFEINEGLWHQLRRGKIITYGRPGGITRSTIKEAAEYVFRQNPYKDYSTRTIKFKCGSKAFENVLQIFKDEVTQQIPRMAALLGSDRLLPKSPVQGSDLKNLSLAEVRFTQVFIPEIGNVEIELDESLNHTGFADRFAQGMHGGNAEAWTSYSMIIWDVTSQEYSNNKDLPKGTELVEGGSTDSNIFIVKPKGEMTYWGNSYGRYNPDRASQIVSSGSYIGYSNWCWNACAVWVKNPDKFVMIELDPEARRGFN